MTDQRSRKVIELVAQRRDGMLLPAAFQHFRKEDEEVVCDDADLKAKSVGMKIRSRQATEIESVFEFFDTVLTGIASLTVESDNLFDGDRFIGIGGDNTIVFIGIAHQHRFIETKVRQHRCGTLFNDNQPESIVGIVCNTSVTLFVKMGCSFFDTNGAPRFHAFDIFQGCAIESGTDCERDTIRFAIVENRRLIRSAVCPKPLYRSFCR